MAYQPPHWRKKKAGRVEEQRSTTKVWIPQAGSQVLFLTCPVFECLYEGTRGPGKSQSVDALVVTPTGMRRIGDLRPGDEVIGRDGRAQRVLSVHPQGVKELWRLTFSDGSTAEASPDHLWQTASSGQGARWNARTMTTRAMKEWMASGKRLSVPLMTGAVEWPEADLPIDPYLMGLYLGDGCSVKYSVVITTTDPETAGYLEGLGFKPKAPIAYRAPDKSMLLALRAFGLEGLTSSDKFVPDAYLYASAGQRLALLQGLMDSDGSVKPEKNRLRFGSTSEALADAVVFLVRSLGGYATKYALQRRDEDRPEYEVTAYLANMASAFRLSRKRALCSPRDLTSPSSRVKRYVERIEAIGECEQVCIRVSNPDHLYVTEDFVVTHNTDALLADFCQHVGQGYGAAWRGILFRSTYKQLSDVVAKSKAWFKPWFPGAKFNEQEYTWTFPDGEQLLLRYMSKPADYDNYHGHAYPWIGWEELTNWATGEMYLKMFSCCRSAVPGMPRKVRATTNPYGKGHNWVKNRWRLPEMRGKVIRTEGEPDRIAIHGHISENRILLDADPEYISRIRAAASNPAQIAAWLDGSWDITSGGMFDDLWQTTTHVVRPFVVPRTWTVDRSFDWGSSKPFSVGWWAESDGTDLVFPDGRRMRTVKGDLFRIAEWYGRKKGTENEGLRMLASDIAEGIRLREIGMGLAGRVKPGPADPAIWSEENGNCIERDMRAKGIRWERADNARKQGWEQVRRRLKNSLNLDEMGQPRGAPREAPGLYVVGERCPDFLRTFVPIPRDEKDPDDVDSDVEDHAADETRYRVMHKRKEVRQGSF